MTAAELVCIAPALCRHHGCTCTPILTIGTRYVHVAHQPHCAPIARSN